MFAALDGTATTIPSASPLDSVELEVCSYGNEENSFPPFTNMPASELPTKKETPFSADPLTLCGGYTVKGKSLSDCGKRGKNYFCSNFKEPLATTQHNQMGLLWMLKFDPTVSFRKECLGESWLQ